MKKHFKFLVLVLILTACAKDNKMLIAKNRLGDLTHSTKISEIEKILSGDSIVKINAQNPYGQVISSTIKEIEVYNTSGQQILLIKPSGGMDSISSIKSIRILTDKFKTKDGLTIGSTFADLKKNHDVGHIQSSMKSVILTLADINAFVSFDKEVLPGDVRFDMDAEIKPTMIPDDAKINRFWLNFEAEADEEN